MKIKIKIVFFTAVMFFFYSCCNFAQNDLSEDQQIKDMLKEFYTSYMTQIDKGPIDPKKENSIREKYCTVKLLKEIENDEELDYDPWLNAQDAGVKSLNTLTIKNNIEISNGYVVTYEDTYAKKKISIKLTVVKEKGGYKIDSVQSEGGKKYGGKS